MSKADEIRKYKTEHPDKDIGAIAKDLNMNYATVRYAVTAMSKEPTAKVVVDKVTKPILTAVPVTIDDTYESDTTSNTKAYSKPNHLKAYCPLCQKEIVGTLHGVQLVGNDYQHLARAHCSDCKLTINMYLANFQIQHHKK